MLVERLRHEIVVMDFARSGTPELDPLAMIYGPTVRLADQFSASDGDPAKECAGIDQQLNKAIEIILEELKTKEKEIPPLPPYAVK
ncbi:MAG: hypothetical protein JSW59_15595 [Phycisphaerales bacterium]|nr:MAG: hypothetical protein JSW59_15595 [Phycisphaerales bacterium]